MKKYKVICIDMFQTLVNVGERSKIIWKRILEDEYTDELCIKYSNLVSHGIVNKFHEEYSRSDKFSTLRCIFENSFKMIFDDEVVSYNHEVATQIFIEEHNNSEWYEDSLSFLNEIKSKYKICLVSDADYDMIQRQIKEIEFDKIVISESVQSYKRNVNGVMFKEVMEHFKCRPEEVLHIGDSSSDIEGANLQNIDTCWINRHEYKRRFDVIPTYEIESFNELEKELL